MEKRWMNGLHNLASAVAKDKMKEPPASKIVLEPPQWFRKKPKANEGHVVEYYKDLEWDSDSEYSRWILTQGQTLKRRRRRRKSPTSRRRKRYLLLPTLTLT